MANKLVDYTVTGPDGTEYVVTASEGASDAELITFAQSNVDKQENTGVAPTSAAPVPVSNEPVQGAAPREMVQPEQETVVIQSFNKGANSEWMNPEAKTSIDSMMADPNFTFEQVDRAVRNQAKSQGLIEVGISGTQESLDKYRESLAAGAAPQATGYERIGLKELGLNEQAPVEAPAEGEEGFFSQIGSAASQAAQEGFGGLAARKIYDLMDTGHDEIRKLYPDITEDQLEDLTDFVIATVQKDLIAANEIKNKNSDWLPWLGGMLLGSGSPIDAVIPGGGKFITKVASGAVGNAVEDVTVQGANVYDGVQDEYRPEQTFLAGTLGGALGGVIDVAGKGASKLAGGNRTVEAPAPSEPYVVAPTGRKNSKAYKQKMTETVEGVQAKANDLSSNWAEAPTYEAHVNFKNLDGVDNDALGARLDDGSIVLNTTRILEEAKFLKVEPDDVVTSLTFHEGLGHHALADRFGDDLDNVLERWYDFGTDSFRKEVDAWMVKNPEGYKGRPDQLARAAEEVLAEMSEKGQIPAKLLDRITNTIKGFARDMGMDFSYSLREVRTILAMSQRAVVDGKGRSAADNGFRASGPRYMFGGREAVVRPDGYNEAKDARSKRPTEQNPWFEGPDGKMRFELSDENARIKDSVDGTGDKFDEMGELQAFGDKAKIRYTFDQDSKYVKESKKDLKGNHDSGYLRNLISKDLMENESWLSLPHVRVFGGIYEDTDVPINSTGLGNIKERIDATTITIDTFAVENGRLPNSIEEMPAAGAYDRMSKLLFNDVLATMNGMGLVASRPAANGKMRLEDILEHPELFEAYPEFKDYMVEHRSGLFDMGALQGSFDPDTGEIQITPYAKDKMSTLLHELQHAIQPIEGFAFGGNPETAVKALSDAKLNEIADKLLDFNNKLSQELTTRIKAGTEIVQLREYTDYVSTHQAVNDGRDGLNSYIIENGLKEGGYWENDPVYKWISEGYRDSQVDAELAEDAFVLALGITDRKSLSRKRKDKLWDILFDARTERTTGKIIRDKEDLAKLEAVKSEIFNADYAEDPREALVKALSANRDISYQAYQHLFGEVEARDVQNRIKLSKAERLRKEPYTSEADTIEPNDYIFVDPLEGTGLAASREGGKQARVRDVKEAIERARAQWDVPEDKLTKVLSEQDFRQEVKLELAMAGKAKGDFEDLYPVGSPKYSKGKSISEVNDVTDKDIAELSDDDIFEIENARHILDSIGANYVEGPPRGWKEAKDDVLRRGFTIGQANKISRVGELDKKMFQYDVVAEKMNDKVTKLYAKMQDGTFTSRDKANYLQTIFKYAELAGQIFEDQGEIGRALNALKAIALTKRKTSDLNDILAQYQDGSSPIGAFADEAIFNKFAKEVQQMLSTGNAAGANAMVRQITKPYWWQYILSFRHAMMLSGLGTHAKNTMDGILITARELEESAMAMAGGFLPRKAAQKAGFGVEDGVSPQEVAGRAYGLLRALFDSDTYLNTARAFRDGHGSTPYSSKIEMQDARIPIVGKVNDALFAMDTFFRAFHSNANLYSLGIRQARSEGYTGVRAFEEGSAKAVNPDQIMLAEAQELANMSLLVDTPSLLSSKLEAIKAIRPNMSGGEQALAFGANVLFPFFRVTDRLLFQAVRRSPLSFMDKNTRADFAAGGAQRDIAIARTLYGTALIMYYWQEAGEGEIQGRRPGDYKKAQALEAGGFRENAVVEDDKYVDATALNLSFMPQDLQNATAANIATIRQDWDKGGDAEDITIRLAAATNSLLTIFASQSFAENLGSYIQPITEENEAMKATSLAGFVGGQASAFVPAAARQANQQYFDPFKRDTRGDKRFKDRVKGRVLSGVPGLSDNLPMKYDLYGDPMPQGRSTLALSNYTDIKQDEVSVELQKLERTQDGAVITGAPTSFEHEGETVKLNAEGQQEWQRRQGWYLKEMMKEEITSPGWNSLTTEEKVEIAKDVNKSAREFTKEDMLPGLGLADE